MRLSTYLKYLVANRIYRLVDLSRDADVFMSDLSRIVNGHRSCGISVLTKLLGALPREHQVQFLMLWLQDQIPVEYDDLVYVVPAVGSESSKMDMDTGTLEGAIECLRVVASKNETVRDLLMFMAGQHKP